MKQHSRSILIVCVILAGFSAIFAYAAEKKVSREFREQFVKDFRRGPLNTTIGDAMMLRILVESARAKRGVEVGRPSVTVRRRNS